MSNHLKDLQSAFMDTLLNNNDSITKHISKQGNISNELRTNIYTNAYRQRLKEVIETDHDVLAHYLGDELFELLIKEYIQSNPSQNRSLRQFCDKLPQYLQKNAPFSEHPVLNELATFERLLLTAFDAAERDSISFEELLNLEPEQWPHLKLQFKPSMQLFKSSYNSVRIWQALKESKTPPDTSNSDAQHWLVWRNLNRVTEFKSIEVSEFKLINQFLIGNDFSQACEEMKKYIAIEDISQTAINYLTHLFSENLVTGFNT